LDRASNPEVLDGAFCVVGDQVAIDRYRGAEAAGGGTDDLGLNIGHVAGGPDATLGGGAVGGRFDLCAQ